MSAGNDERRDSADPAASSGMDLRRRAEEKASAMQARDLESLSPEEVKHLVHELHVHQIELEMQNEALRRSEKKYGQLIETMNEGVWAIDKDANITLVNPRMAEIMGYTVEEMTGKPLVSLLDQSGVEFAGRKLERRRQGVKEQYEGEARRKDGTAIYLSVSTSPVTDSEGSYAGSIAVVQDITECKKAEVELKRQEQHFRALVENASDAIVLLNLDGTISYESSSMGRVLGLKPEQRIGVSVFDRVHPGDMRVVTDAFRTLLENPNAEVQRAEIRVRHADGRWRTFEAAGSSIVRDSVVQAVVINLRDVTERKRAEEALRDSEEQFRFLTEQSLMGIHIIQNGKIIYVNKATSEMCGFSIDEITNWERNGFARVIHPDDLPVVMEQARRKQAGEKGTVVKYQWRLITKSGEVKWIESWSKTIMITDAPSDFVTMIDITERKRVEEALRTSQERLFLATEGAGLGIWNWNIVTGELIWNDKCKALFGIRLDETMSYQRFVDALHPDDREKTDRAVKDALDNHQDYDIEYRSLWSDGSIHWLAAKGRGYYDATGKAVRMEGVVLDIAQRKRAEEALRENERHYRLLAENLSDVIWTMGTDLKYTYVSPSVTRLRGYSVEEAMAQPLEENLSPASVETALRILAEEAAKERTGLCNPNRVVTMEVQLSCKDGSTMWAENKVSYLRDADGRITGYLGVTRDISERRKTEESLRESQEKLSLFMNSATDAFTIWDSEFRLVDLNKVALDYLPPGVRKEDVLGRHYLDFMPGSKEKGIYDKYLDVMRTGEPLSMDDTKPDPRYGERHFSARVFKVGEGLGIITTDITELKLAEEALRGSEEKFRAVFMQSPIGIVLYDRAGARVASNKACREIFGLTDAGEIKAPSLLDDPAVTEKARQMLREGKTITWEGPLDLDKAREAGVYDARRPGIVYVRGMMLALGHGNGQALTGYMALLEDVTDRKKAEEALRENEEKFRAVFMQSPVGLQLFDAEGKNLIVNPACLEILGAADPSEIKSLSLFDFPFVPESAKEGSRKGESVTFEVPYDFEAVKLMKRYGTPKSGVIHLSVGVAPVRLTEGSDKIVHYLVQVQDVTERKQAEEKIKQQLLELQRWHNVTLDREGRVRNLKLEVNELLKRLGEPDRYSSTGYGETETPLTEWGGKESREERQRP
jgi:PAS domain S-box-containing protein